MVGLKAGGDRLRPGETGSRVGVVECPGQATVDPGGERLGQVVSQVAPLVEGAALDLGRLAEDAADAGREGLGALDDDEQAASRREGPRAWRSARSAVTIVAFSVSPRYSPTGTLRPSVVMTRAATQLWPATAMPATAMPSTMRTATSRSERSRAMSSARARSVARPKRRETAERLVPLARASSSAPSGSATSA